MSYSKCFVCGADNYSGNENRVTVEQIRVDKEWLMQRTFVWKGYMCDECLSEHFGMVGDMVVGR